MQRRPLSLGLIPYIRFGLVLTICIFRTKNTFKNSIDTNGDKQKVRSLVNTPWELDHIPVYIYIWKMVGKKQPTSVLIFILNYRVRTHHANRNKNNQAKVTKDIPEICYHYKSNFEKFSFLYFRKTATTTKPKLNFINYFIPLIIILHTFFALPFDVLTSTPVLSMSFLSFRFSVFFFVFCL